MNVRELLDAQPPASALSDTVAVRLEPESLAALDRIEASLRGQGDRRATRSALVRLAVRRFVNELEEKR